MQRRAVQRRHRADARSTLLHEPKMSKDRVTARPTSCPSRRRRLISPSRRGRWARRRHRVARYRPANVSIQLLSVVMEMRKVRACINLQMTSALYTRRHCGLSDATRRILTIEHTPYSQLVLSKRSLSTFPTDHLYAFRATRRQKNEIGCKTEYVDKNVYTTVTVYDCQYTTTINSRQSHIFSRLVTEVEQPAHLPTLWP